MLRQKLHELIPIRLAQPMNGRQNTQLSQSFSELGTPLIDVDFGWHGNYLVLHSTGSQRGSQAESEQCNQSLFAAYCANVTRMKRTLQLAFTLTLLFAASQNAIAQPAAVAEKAVGQSTATADTDVPGVGPIRALDPKFQKRFADRHATFAKLKAGQQNALVFFGDSITQGWGDDFRGAFPNVKVANRGIGGDTSRGLLARVDDDVLALNPRGVVLLIGTNDIDLQVPAAGIAENVKLLIAKITAHDPNTPIILCQVMPTSPKKNRPTEKIRELNQLLADVARGNEHVTLLDTYTLFANADGEAKPEEFPDLLHLNKAGYAKWRAALWPLLATLGFVEKEADAFKPEEGFTALFNGHDLTGWGFRPTPAKEAANIKKRKPNDKKSPAYSIVETATNFDGASASADGRYRAIAGRLVVTTPTEGRRIQQLSTTRDFTGDFTLKLDFRATPNADSGVFVRGRQLQCRDYPLAGPYKDLKKYKSGDWNELVIDVHDNKARCTCNGEVLEEAYKLPEKGPIGLEGDRGQMEYRHIRIKQ
jgi:lysophospholipase L1-like esterase